MCIYWHFITMMVNVCSYTLVVIVLMDKHLLKKFENFFQVVIFDKRIVTILSYRIIYED